MPGIYVTFFIAKKVTNQSKQVLLSLFEPLAQAISC